MTIGGVESWIDEAGTVVASASKTPASRAAAGSITTVLSGDGSSKSMSNVAW